MQVFLSYASEDAETARRVTERLAREQIAVWDAERELLPGDNFHEAIGRALESSDAMVVLLSPSSSRSKYLQAEIEYALQNRAYAGRLIPVMVRNTKDFPWILRKLQMVDLTDDESRGLDEIASALTSSVS